MVRPTRQRDPRSIITPEAFVVSDALLGKPLAPPLKRLWAMMIDVGIIGLVTAVTRSFALVLGVVAALLFMRAGFKRTPVKGSVFGRAMRFSVGCLGIMIAFVTAAVWASFGVDFSNGEDSEVADALDAGNAAARVMTALARAGVVRAFEEAQTIQEAERQAVELIEVAEELGMEDDELRAFLTAAVPANAPWAPEAGPLFARLLRDAPTEATAPALDATVEREIAEYSDIEVLDAYARAIRAADGEPEASGRLRALEARLAGVVARDTMRSLEERIQALERRSTAQQRDLQRASEALDEAGSGGVFGWLRGVVDELGFGFGWASLYLTVFLSWWNGQTIGKRVLGLRVLRLDGEPITWWVAFERAGGYAAGFATGLLGFAQVFWDANRQAIHDRIAGTVVVIDRADRVLDWESVM